MTKRASRWVRYPLVALAIGLPLFAAFTMVVHLPAVQYAMGWTKSDGTGACPFGYDQPAVAQRVHTGGSVQALGFVLGKTSKDELAAWSKTHDVRCQMRRGSYECRDVPAALLAGHGAALAGTTVWFELDGAGTLVTVKTARRASDASALSTAFVATSATLAKDVGAPVVATGSPSELSLGAFRQATREFKRDGYRALVRATNMGDGFLLTESYTAL